VKRLGRVNIQTSSWHRDARLERRLIEMKREQIIWGLVIAGCALILVAILW